MKKKLLAVLLIMLIVLIVPIISSCSCNNAGDPGEGPGEVTGSGGTETGGTGSGGGDIIIPPDDGEDEVIIPTGSITPIIKYLRVVEIGENSITLKINVIGDGAELEVRKSTKEITSKNYSKATEVDFTLTGDGEVKTIVIDGMTAGAEEKHYFAVQAKLGSEYSTIETIRVGGIEIIHLDPDKVDSVYLGEVIKDASTLIDESDIVGDPSNDDIWDNPVTGMDRFYYPAGYAFHNHTRTAFDERFGTLISPIFDLEFNHYIDSVYLYYARFEVEKDFYNKEGVYFCRNIDCPNYGYDKLIDPKNVGEDKACPKCGKADYMEYTSFQISRDVVVRWAKNAADFQTPDAWDGSITLTQDQLASGGWTEIEIGAEIRYLQVSFVDGGSPEEVLFYGYQTSESDETIIGETIRELPTMGELMGQCALLGSGGGYCTIEQLSATTVVREYHNVGWSYSNTSFPNKSTLLANTVVGNFDATYKLFSESEANLLIIPCLQWNESSSPARVYDYETGKLSGTIATWEEKYDPQTYAAIADLIYQYAARYGSSKMGYLYENAVKHSDMTSDATVGRNYIQWIEIGNEPNGEDQAGATPYQLAALQSAAYDGHQRTLLADVYNPDQFTYFFGGKNADPDIKLAMSGLAGLGNRYITSMVYWMRANRTDGCIAIDAFNYHTYFGKSFTLNGQTITVGVSPEEWGLADALSKLIEYRDKYYPDVEIWLTEFGWDTNQSYETPTSAHVYGEYEDTPLGIIKRAREIQGMWLTRAFLIMSAIGMDKATLYMCEDVYTNEMTAVGKYGTCGIWAYEFLEDGSPVCLDADGNRAVQITEKDADGKDVTKWVLVDDMKTPANTTGISISSNNHMVAKDGYYYLYTLKNTLGDKRFVRELATGRDDVWVYQYESDEGDVAYAAWCPTSNDTVVNSYKLYVGDVASATLVEADSDNKDIDGVHTELEVVNGFVTIRVTENPCYVVVD